MDVGILLASNFSLINNLIRSNFYSFIVASYSTGLSVWDYKASNLSV
jgi:hypothetical protein